MMTRVIIIIISIILTFSQLHSQQNSYSTLMIGDTIQLLKSDISSGADIFFYIFWDKYSCPICKEDTESIISELGKYYNVRTQLFLGETSQSDLEIMIEELPRGWNFIADELSVYAKHFGVLSYPVYYLLSHNGEILFIGKSGGGVSNNTLNKIIDRSLQGRKENKFDEIKTQLDYSHEFTQARYRAVLYSTKSHDIYMMIPGVKDIAIYNEKGKLTKRLVLDLENSINRYDLNWVIEDSLFILLHDSYNDYREYYLIDVKTNNYKKIPIEKPDYLKNQNINHKFDIISNQIMTNLKPYDSSKLDSTFSPLISFDYNTGKAFNWGSPPYTFMNFKKSTLFAAIFANYDEKIFVLFDTDNTLFEYSIKDFNLISKEEIDFKEYSKHILKEDIPEFKDTRHKIEFYKDVITFDKMYALDSKTICILANQVVVLDKFSITKYDIYFKLFFIDIETKAVTKVIELGTENKPYFVDNKYIYFTKLIGNKMYNSKISYTK